MKSIILRISVTSCVLALSLLATYLPVQAQQDQLQRIAAKSGESIELHTVFAQANCRSTLLATPEIEVLEGPPELTLSIKEEMVAAPITGCHNKLKGGVVIATIGDVKKPIEGKLTYRVKFKTKVKNNQLGKTYYYSLFPGKIQ
jgi:hypothetical protein